MRARLLRSSLIAAALGLLLVGAPVLGVMAHQLVREVDHELARRAELVASVVQAIVLPVGGTSGSADRSAPSAESQGARSRGAVARGLDAQSLDLTAVRSAVDQVLRGGRYGDVASAQVQVAGASVVVGPRSGGPTRSATARRGPVWVEVQVPRSAATNQVLLVVGGMLALSVLGFGLAAGTAVLQARRLIRPLDLLADNAERLGRGESRLQPIVSGIPELDRVAAGLERSAGTITSALAAERDFASDASHQLRTPLTAVSMRLEEIASSDDMTQVREEARVALAQVERLTQVVDALLSRSRRTHRRTTVPIDLLDFLREVVREWEPAFKDAGRRLVLAPVEPIRVSATPSALSQVVATLVENGLHHGRGPVTITVRRTGGSVVLEFTDRGPGVPAELGSRIFERAISGGGSTGLGLALARDLAEADGGRLELVRARPPVFAVFLDAVADGVKGGVAVSTPGTNQTGAQSAHAAESGA
ncbi:MAG: sensor histidine kinase [Angustibacter sp.]